MKRVLFLAAAALSACPASKPCSDTDDCDPGQQCIQSECRATSGGGTGGGAGGGTGGGSTIFTGCDPDGGIANQTRDTDCDGLSDSAEYNLWKTDPCNSDTDGDGVSDGVELGVTTPFVNTCTTFVPDLDPTTKTDPKKADTDGDGLNDGAEDLNGNGRVDPGESSPLKLDTDCDGYSDKQERDGVPGCATDPSLIDTDGDGLPDGVEGGLQPPGADPAGCTYPSRVFDANPATTTNPCSADSDGDGIADGAEDSNQNGSVNPGELDPNDNGDVSDTVAAACAIANLKPITFHIDAVSDVQLALEPTFAEVTQVQTAAGVRIGHGFYDSATKVAGLAISKTPAGSTPGDEEANARTRIGGVSNPLTQSFATWDGFPAVRAIYDASGSGDVKEKVNALIESYGGAGVTGALSGTAGAAGPFKIVAEYVRRSANRAVVVIGVLPANLYTGQALFRIDDAAGGTALAQYGDSTLTQCEVFNASVNAKVDFVWVVDDSCSMASSQGALQNASSLFAGKLGGAGLDWQAAAVSTSWFDQNNSNDKDWYSLPPREWTTDAGTMQAWFTQFGIGGKGQEAGFISAQNLLNGAGGANPLTVPPRSEAQTHLIFLTDTHEQSNTPVVATTISVASMQTWMNGLGTQRAVAHGITCPEGINCDDGTTANSKYDQLVSATGGVLGDIRTFKQPTSTHGAQQAAVIDAILSAVIGGTGTQLQRPPISATIKVAVASTAGTCNKDDVPRSRTSGWDIDAATLRLVFYGDCRPSGSGVQVAVSYKYWVEGSINPDGDPCEGTCGEFQTCDSGETPAVCVCPSNCDGRCGSGLKCEPTACVCVPDIG